MDHPSSVAPTNENCTGDWRSQNFRDGMASQIQQAMVHCGTLQPPTNNARDLETRAFSRSSSKSEYIDFVGQVIIRLNVVNNGDMALEGPKEPSVYEIHDDPEAKQVMPSAYRKRPMRGADGLGRKQGVNSFQTTVVHEVGLSSDHGEMKPGSSDVNAKEERAFAGPAPAANESKDGTEIKINRKRRKSECEADDIMNYLLRLIREDKEKQIKDITDCYKGDVENEEFKEKKRAIEKFSDECVAKVNEICSCQESVEKETTGVPTDNDPLPTYRPPSYLCDQWSHELYKDPVVTPSGFTYERKGIENHLKNVGQYDPVTHVKLTADLLIPNHAMKQVVYAYMSDSAAKPGSASPRRDCSSPKRLRGTD